MSSIDPPVERNLPTSESVFTPRRLKELRGIYHAALFDDLIPWWQEHSIDTKAGGYLTRLDRKGQPYSFDKDMWMTGRQVWMFSHLYLQHAPRPLWLEIARTGAEFMLQHAFRPDGKMVFRTDRQGRPLASILSVYTKVFAAIGLAEYGQAAGDNASLERAHQLYGQLETELPKLTDTPLLGYPLEAEIDLHSRQLCLMTIGWVFGELFSEERFACDSSDAMHHILTRHWKPERGVLLENIGPQGEELFELPEGRLVNPGHALESAWMMLEIADRQHNQAVIETCCDIILASLEVGWDDQHGGIFYLKNVDGSPCHSIEADCKLWWPHGEALYATLLAWSLTRRPEFATWYEKIHGYTFSHFPDTKYGEWYGYLNRDGSPIWTAKANGWKGFFHLPRVMLRVHQLLRSLTNSTDAP